jgi:peptide-methionine (S)-S-oxide reductase
MPDLPARPSAEYLRKEAKRLARAETLPLASAQRTLAASYGFRNWAELMREAARKTGDAESMPRLLAAVRAGDIDRVRTLLSDGENPRLGDGRSLPLHAAARSGPLELVETLIAGGALPWQLDPKGRSALECARLGNGLDRDAIVALLDRTTIVDPAFRDAVAAIHIGDVASLKRLLDENADLLQRRNVEPEAYRQAKRHDYFRDPKLFWYVANNPTSIERLPSNIADVARSMIERGVEQSDLDYALALLMSGGEVGEVGAARSLMNALLDAGAVANREAILVTAGHWQSEALHALLERGQHASPLIAAALGDVASLSALLQGADRADVQDAFGLAIINRHLDAAQVALDMGADVNAMLPVHSHSTALHQAAAFDSDEMIAFLVARGARLDTRDTLWNGTPLDWASHEKHDAARAALQRAQALQPPYRQPDVL